MRTVLLDLGQLAHLGGQGALSGKSMSNYDLLTSPAGKGIVVQAGVITSIEDSSDLREEYGGPDQSDRRPFE